MPASILGVWNLVSIVYVSGPEMTTIDPALPGLFIFTKNHYSMTWMPLQKQQEDYADLWHPNDSEKVQSYNSIVTNTGSYVLSKTELVTSVEVAKTPAFIGGKAIYACELGKDELRLEVLDTLANDGTRDESYLKFKTILKLQRIE